jgi:hypothetical protein
MASPTLELVVAAELADDFSKHQHLLPVREISRSLNPEGTLLVLTVTAPDGAPEQAATMSPWFTLTGDRIELGGIDYYDAEGHCLPPVTKPITTSDVPEALRGTRWKP